MSPGMKECWRGDDGGEEVGEVGGVDDPSEDDDDGEGVSLGEDSSPGDADIIESGVEETGSGCNVDTAAFRASSERDMRVQRYPFFANS
jgi:hypothetical protein